jgi:hypothetical protein
LICHFQVVPAEASEAKPEISGEGAEDAAPIPAPSPKKKRQKLVQTSSEDERLNKALQFIMNESQMALIHLGSMWPWS